jgi:hypothetical protein
LLSGAREDPDVDALGTGTLKDTGKLIAGAAGRQYIVDQCQVPRHVRARCGKCAAHIAPPIAGREASLILRDAHARAEIHADREHERAADRARELECLVESTLTLLRSGERHGDERLR